jgi:hypothetical protein
MQIGDCACRCASPAFGENRASNSAGSRDRFRQVGEA